jgi:hypothetical protein
MGIKWARRRHQNPLEFTGETYWATIKKSGSKLDANSNRAQLTFVGARKLSFRHPKSKIRMQDEFRRITPREARELAKFYDGALDRILAANNDQTQPPFERTETRRHERIDHGGGIGQGG